MSLGWCEVCRAPVNHISASRDGLWMGPCGHWGRMLTIKPIHWFAPRVEGDTNG